jgi:hypothetical protein
MVVCNLSWGFLHADRFLLVREQHWMTNAFWGGFNVDYTMG